MSLYTVVAEQFSQKLCEFSEISRERKADTLMEIASFRVCGLENLNPGTESLHFLLPSCSVPFRSNAFLELGKHFELSRNAVKLSGSLDGGPRRGPIRSATSRHAPDVSFALSRAAVAFWAKAVFVSSQCIVFYHAALLPRA